MLPLLIFGACKKSGGDRGLEKRGEEEKETGVSGAMLGRGKRGWLGEGGRLSWRGGKVACGMGFGGIRIAPRHNFN